MNFQPHEFAPYIPLAGCFLNAFFAIFVYTRNTSALPNRIYLVVGLCIAIWNLGSYFMFVVQTADEALFWARFLHIGLIIGIAAFFHLMLIIADCRVGRWIVALYVAAIGIAITGLTPLFISGVRKLNIAGWYAISGPAYPAFGFLLTLMFVSTFLLVRRRHTMPRLQTRRLTPLIFASFALTLFGCNDVLPILSFDHYPGTKIAVYPWGSLAAVFYGIVAAYSVLQFELLDSQVALSRAAAHFVRFAFLVSIATGLLLAVAILTNYFTTASFFLALAVFVVSGITATLLFPRLFGGKGIENLERRLLGDRFEYQDRVRVFIEGMPWYDSLDALLDDIDDLLNRAFNLESYQLVIRDEANRGFTLARAHPGQPPRQVSELVVPSATNTLFTTTDTEWVALDGAYAVPGGKPLETKTRTELASFGAQFAFPLVAESGLVGLLLVGPKRDESPFTRTDLTLLASLTKNTGLIANQIRLKDQILRAQELELLGRMSRGMAHDLNNLLTPISTLLQLANEDASREDLDEELLGVALRNLKTVRAYIKEALFFSEHARPDMQLCRLDMTVRQVVELARANQNKSINVVAETEREALAEVDEVLIERLLTNLVSNAIDASPPGSEVRVVLELLAKTEEARDWLRIRVIDQGEGLSEEVLQRIQTPYFTTKNRGDERRGFGLGLAICRKIVALHAGHLSINSRVGHGTTVQIDLPSRPKKPVFNPAVSAA